MAHRMQQSSPPEREGTVSQEPGPLGGAEEHGAVGAEMGNGHRDRRRSGPIPHCLFGVATEGPG